ncbi:MAG TPA: GNAT family N-acetyltransferase [Candidatus Sulfotelmatobacter sp.]|nr:GNAT family N-acetyltransferase [Candidatus Sulfotelmatobacter sp.]
MKLYTLREIAREVETPPFLSMSRKRNFFNLPEWFALLERCCLEKGWHAMVAAAENDELAIVCRHQPRGHALFSFTTLYTPRFDLLGHSPALRSIREFGRQLACSSGRLEYIRLEGLDVSGGSFRALLDGLGSAGWAVKPYFGWAMWCENTANIGFEYYLSARNSVLRNTWKRKQALLAKTATPRWKIYGVGEDPDFFITLYEQIHQRSWKKPEPFPDFIPGLIRMAAAVGALRMGVLFINDLPAAAQFWIVWEGTATIYKLVHAQEFAQFSPGTLLTMEMMRRVLNEDKPAEIDFGRGDDSYKKLWLSSRSERWGIEAANPRTLNGIPRSFRILAGIARDSMSRKLSRAVRRAAPGSSGVHLRNGRPGRS